MVEVTLPRENTNDDTAVVVEVCVASGDTVAAGDLVCIVETTKAAQDITAPESGVVHHALSEGEEIAVGAVLFRVGDDAPAEAPDSPAEAAHPEVQLVSEAAALHLSAAGVDPATVEKPFVTLADAQAATNTGGPAPQAKSPAPALNRGVFGAVILGGGGHAKMCIDVLRQRNEFEILGILDARLSLGQRILDVPVIGSDQALDSVWKDGVRFAINGVGSVARPSTRTEVYERLKRAGFIVPNLIHPSAVIEPSARMGEGNQVMMGACVGSDVTLEDNVIVNSGAIVSHDCVLASHSHIAPGAILAGGVRVGSEALVGMGASIYMSVEIAAGRVVQNGSDIFQ